MESNQCPPHAHRINKLFSVYKAGDDAMVGQLDPRIAEQRKRDVDVARATEAAFQSVRRDLDDEDNAFEIKSQCWGDREEASTLGPCASAVNQPAAALQPLVATGKFVFAAQQFSGPVFETESRSAAAKQG